MELCTYRIGTQNSHTCCSHASEEMQRYTDNIIIIACSHRHGVIYLQACMFVNISPLESNTAETVSALEFGLNARQVELGKATKNITRLPPQF